MAEPNNKKIKFTKTETEYNMKSIRFLTLTISAMFIAIALLLIVLGNSVYGHYHSYQFFYVTGSVGRYITPASICIFLGIGLLVVAIMGLYGSLRKSTCMVNVYAFILLIAFIIKLVIVCLALSMDPDIIRNHLNIPIWDIEDPEIRAEVNFIQSSLGCCGNKNYMDYMGMKLPANMSVTTVSKVIDQDVVSMTLPASCCVNPTETSCSRMWASGCQEALVTFMMQNSVVIGVLAISVMVINLLGITFALLLARSIRKMKSEKALMSWKIKEQEIMARQAAEIENNEKNKIYIDHQTISVA